MVIACLVALGGCTPDLSPQDVADRFWRAVITAEPAKIRRYVRAADQAGLERDTDLLAVTAVEFGRAEIAVDSAAIETQVTLAGEQAVTIPIKTRLVRENDAWRVDYQATVGAIARGGELAGVIEQIERLGETLKQGIDRSVDELSGMVPKVEQELSRIEAEIEHRVPQLRQQVEEFSRRIEEALKSAPGSGAPLPAPAPAPGGTTAI